MVRFAHAKTLEIEICGGEVSSDGEGERPVHGDGAESPETHGLQDRQEAKGRVNLSQRIGSRSDPGSAHESHGHEK